MCSVVVLFYDIEDWVKELAIRHLDGVEEEYLDLFYDWRRVELLFGKIGDELAEEVKV